METAEFYTKKDREIEKLEEKVEKLTSERDKLQKDLSVMENSVTDKIKKLLEKNDDLVKEVAGEHLENKELKAKISDLEKELSAKNNQITKMYKEGRDEKKNPAPETKRRRPILDKLFNRPE